jgi:hypothetical protein
MQKEQEKEKAGIARWIIDRLIERERERALTELREARTASLRSSSTLEGVICCMPRVTLK